jgi:hypothetical protein
MILLPRPGMAGNLFLLHTPYTYTPLLDKYKVQGSSGTNSTPGTSTRKHGTRNGFLVLKHELNDLINDRNFIFYDTSRNCKCSEGLQIFQNDKNLVSMNEDKNNV